MTLLNGLFALCSRLEKRTTECFATGDESRWSSFSLSKRFARVLFGDFLLWVPKMIWRDGLRTKLTFCCNDVFSTVCTKNVSYLNYNGILRGLLSLLPRTCESSHHTHASLKIATKFLPQKAFGSLKRVINRMHNISESGLGISECLPIKWSAFFCRCQGRNILPSELCKWRCHQALKRQKMS